MSTINYWFVVNVVTFLMVVVEGGGEGGSLVTQTQSGQSLCLQCQLLNVR